MFLDQPIENLPQTSSLTKQRFKKLGLKTYHDLLSHFPSRHEDYSRIKKISYCRPGEIVSVIGQVTNAQNQYLRKGMIVQKISLADESGQINISWFNQPFLIRLFPIGSRVAIAGEITFYNGSISIKPHEYELIRSDQPPIHTRKIIPIYPTTSNLSSRTIRTKIFYLLNELKQNIYSNELKDCLPSEFISQWHLLPEKEAYYSIHFPANLSILKKAKRRLAFNELFFIQLSSQLTKKRWQNEKLRFKFKLDSTQKVLMDKFINQLPFKLTPAQEKVLQEILNDLKRERPMNRFLQGDVGSGKTIVAALAAYLVYLNGYKTLFMVPTEILAEQHYRNLERIFRKTGLHLGLQTGSHKLGKRINSFNLIIGTQALIQKKVNFDKVGLIVIDEQQRFGVTQRATLKAKGVNPHLLTMTATPIPRTVALTLYGELDMSIINKMPPGRKKIKTYLVPKTKRKAAYQWIKKMIITKKNQVFIICPLIEKSTIETMKSIKAAKQEYDYLAKTVYPDLKIGLIHGKMKAKEKQTVMVKFKKGLYQILVATSVVEVGIDISRARIIVIEGAERYGLAQLHQLRGRVGRDDKQSYCLIFSDSQNKSVLDRLRYFTTTNNGLDLAEYDLKKRGPGTIFGTQQHGYFNLNIASLFDEKTIRETKKAAKIFSKEFNLKDQPELEKRLKKYHRYLITRD